MISDIRIASGYRIIVTPDPDRGLVLLAIWPPGAAVPVEVPFDAYEADDHCIIFGNAADELVPQDAQDVTPLRVGVPGAAERVFRKALVDSIATGAVTPIRQPEIIPLPSSRSKP